MQNVMGIKNVEEMWVLSRVLSTVDSRNPVLFFRCPEAMCQGCDLSEREGALLCV